jgi:hypothetical protein
MWFGLVRNMLDVGSLKTLSSDPRCLAQHDVIKTDNVGLFRRHRPDCLTALKKNKK